MDIYKELKLRRSYYRLDKQLPVGKDVVQQLIEEVTELVPDAFNMKSLLFEHLVCPLHNGTEHAVDGVQDHRKEEDAETERKGTEQRIDVDGFGTSQSLHAYQGPCGPADRP